MFVPLHVREIPVDISELQPFHKTLIMDEHQRVIKVKIDEWNSRHAGRL